MKSRDPVQVRIETLAVDGCGYSEDAKLAVYGALPGEHVTAAPLARKRKRLYLRATAIDEASPHRVQPVCGAADYCGGCVFQHLEHEEQLRLKSGLLKEVLAPLVPDTWLPPVTGPRFHYRSKARLGVKYVEKKGRVLVGFREKLKPYIAETASCPVLTEPASDLLAPLATLIESLSVCRSIPQVELASGRETALIFRHLESLTDEDLQKLAEFARDNQVRLYLQPGGPDTVHRLYPVDCDDDLSYRLTDLDLEFLFSPTDFTQVNLGVNQQMVASALELLALEPGDSVLDAFCGIGNFSLAVSRFAGQVLGLEHSAQSVARARLNASRNGIENARFEAMDLHDPDLVLPEISSINKVLLDPPRSGALELVKGLATTNVERVVYVSCNPETLARDVKLLVGQGLHLRSAGIIDMFPHTTHVESIALLTRPGQSI